MLSFSTGSLLHVCKSIGPCYEKRQSECARCVAAISINWSWIYTSTIYRMLLSHSAQWNLRVNWISFTWEREREREREKKRMSDSLEKKWSKWPNPALPEEECDEITWGPACFALCSLLLTSPSASLNKWTWVVLPVDIPSYILYSYILFSLPTRQLASLLFYLSFPSASQVNIHLANDSLIKGPTRDYEQYNGEQSCCLQKVNLTERKEWVYSSTANSV